MNDLNGWKYEANLVNGVYDFKVIPSNPVILPETLYKFHSLSRNAVDALTHLYVYASHPSQLNDPFDCCNDIIQINEEDSMRILWDKFYKDFCQIYQNDRDRIEASNEAFSTIIFRKWGVLSLTQNKDSELMWSLYANNTGFRLEFDITEFPFPFKGPFPINYCNELPQVQTSEYGVPCAALIQTNVKNKSWSHEKEWRLLVPTPVGFDMQTFGHDAEKFNTPDDHDRKFHYPLRALKSLTLGVNFFNDAQLDKRLFVVGRCEIIIVYLNECLQTQMLDFLDEVQKKYPLQVYLASINKENSTFEDIPIKVIKISKFTYHIIECEPSPEGVRGEI